MAAHRVGPARRALARSGRRAGAIAWLAGVLALGACASIAEQGAASDPEPAGPAPTIAMVAAARAEASRPAASDGAIYDASRFRSLFQDRRASRVGDILTIQIQEKTTARSSSSSSLGRSGSVEASVSKLPFVNADSPLTPRLGAAGSSSHSFEGKGEAGADNAFNGVITVTVVEVLSNGNLVVSGDKRVGINRASETLRFTGVVDPATVLPGNLVSSTQVADARLAVRGNGDLGRVHTPGWLARFFMSFLPI